MPIELTILKNSKIYVQHHCYFQLKIFLGINKKAA